MNVYEPVVGNVCVMLIDESPTMRPDSMTLGP